MSRRRRAVMATGPNEGVVVKYFVQSPEMSFVRAISVTVEADSEKAAIAQVGENYGIQSEPWHAMSTAHLITFYMLKDDGTSRMYG